MFLTALELYMARRPNKDPRSNTSTPEHVEHGLQIAKHEGVGPALAVMQETGVPRQVAVRVLASPSYIRSKERRMTANYHSGQVAGWDKPTENYDE